MFLMYPPSLPHRYHHDGLEHGGRLVLVDDDAMSVPFNMSFVVLAKQGPEWTRTFVRPPHTHKVGTVVQAVWRHKINQDAFWLDGTIESAAGHNLVNIPTYNIVWDDKDTDSEKQRHGRALVRTRPKENTAENDSYATGTHAKYALGREETEGQAAAPPAKAPSSKRKNAGPNMGASASKKGKKAPENKAAGQSEQKMVADEKKKKKTMAADERKKKKMEEQQQQEERKKQSPRQSKSKAAAKGVEKLGTQGTPQSPSKNQRGKKKPAAKRPSNQPNPFFKPKPFRSPRPTRSNSGSTTRK